MPTPWVTTPSQGVIPLPCPQLYAEAVRLSRPPNPMGAGHHAGDEEILRHRGRRDDCGQDGEYPRLHGRRLQLHVTSRRATGGGEFQSIIPLLSASNLASGYASF